MKSDDFTKERVLELLSAAGGKADLTTLLGLSKSKGYRFDKTHLWDRLVTLRKAGLVKKNEDGTWEILRPT